MGHVGFEWPTNFSSGWKPELVLLSLLWLEGIKNKVFSQKVRKNLEKNYHLFLKSIKFIRFFFIFSRILGVLLLFFQKTMAVMVQNFTAQAQY